MMIHRMPAGGTAASGFLRGRVRRVDQLRPKTVEAMWSLFARHYDSVSREAFDRDLSHKQYVVICRDTGDRSVQGFSTLQILERKQAGSRYVAIFSGDTIIDSRYWGQTALQRAFLRFIAATKLKHPTVAVYWFLISKGYKTYLLLARNFADFWPRRDVAFPARERAILAELAREKYPEAWRPERGVLEFEDCPGRLRAEVAPVDAEALEDPDVRFFAKANPGHARGDELCCLGKIDASLCLSAARKFVRRRIEQGRRRAG